MTAREMFTIGQRVKLSTDGLAVFGARRGPVFGEVVGFSYRSPAIVRVRKDGNKVPAAYHMHFWTGAK